jgi:hypothetical protein
MADDIKPVDKLDVISKMSAGELGDAVLERASERDDRPEPPAPVKDERPEQAAKVLKELGADPDELAAVVKAHPELFPAGSAETPEDFALAARTMQALAAKDRQVAQLSEKAKAEAAYAAEEAYDSAEDDADVYAALDTLAEKVGLDDPRFKEFLSTVASDDGGDRVIAEEWLQDRAEEAAEAASLAEFDSAAARMVARAKAAEQFEAQAAETVGNFLEQNKRAIEKAGPTFAETLQAIDVTGAESAEELETNLGIALRGAQEGNRVDALHDFSRRFLETALRKEPSYYDSEGHFSIPGDIENEKIDASRLAPQPPRSERLKAFGDAFDRLTGASGERRAEADKAAARTEKYVEEQTAKHGRRPR